MSILRIIMVNLAIVFWIDIVPRYLPFKISNAMFPVSLSINEYSTHNNGQFGGCFIKIKQILSILQGF